MSARLALSNLAAWWLQVAVLVAAAAVLVRAGRLAAPHAVIGYWRAVLLAALTLPALVPRRAPSATSDGFTTIVDVVVSPVSAPGGFDVAPFLLAFMAAVSGARLLGLGRGLQRVHRWSDAGPRLRPGPALEDCARQAGAAADVRLCDAIRIPATHGWRRPVVLLPMDFTSWPESHQRHALLHELVHVRRHDWFAALVEEGLAALLWFHPAVRWAIGEVRVAREQAVDEEVATLVDARRAYAETLIALAARPQDALPIPALFTSKLERRIEALLKEDDMSKTRVAAMLATSAAVLLLVASVTARAVPLRAATSDEPTVAGGVESEKKVAAERKVVQKANPVYPAEAKAKGIEGDVVLDVLITAAGDVTDVKVRKGPDALRTASESAVRQWRFEPGPIDTRANLTVRFSLGKKESPQP